MHADFHLDAVGTKRVTMIYNSRDVLSVSGIARSRGVKSSEIYRSALRQYLEAQNLSAPNKARR